jgi:hypothetical protein
MNGQAGALQDTTADALSLNGVSDTRGFGVGRPEEGDNGLLGQRFNLAKRYMEVSDVSAFGTD